MVDVATPPAATAARRRTWLDRLEQRGLLHGGGWRVLALLGGVVVLGLVVALSLGFGSRPIPLREVVEAFTAFDGSNDHLIVVACGSRGRWSGSAWAWPSAWRAR